jgi:hypothetical protein
MKNQNEEEIIYSLNIEDVQTVAQQEIERNLTKKEIEDIIEIIASNVNWYDAIAVAINENIEAKP